MNRRFTLLISLVLLLLAAASAWVLSDLLDIRSEGPGPGASAASRPEAERPAVGVGVVSRFAPNMTFAGYQPVIDYLNRHGTRRYELHLSTSYLDAVEDLRRGEVAASFLGAWIFAHLDGDDLVPLAAPLNADGRSDFRALLVTRPETGIASVADLAGRSVALPASRSWSGNWLQATGLAAAGLTLADLDSVRHFDHHQTVAWQVLKGRFDAGVVKEAVAERYLGEGLVIVARSEPIPGPPLVGTRGGPADVQEEIARLLLALDPADPQDRAVLDGWSSEFSHGFGVVEARRYREAFAGEGR